MCGIAGFLSADGFEPRWGAELARTMGETLAARGPDSFGEWVDGTAGIALAHRRLSIQDLSACGNQPMISADGRFVMIFNGEIYNHLEIRADIGPHAWRGHSDTETLLEGICRWGLEDTLRRSVGMFALALWDRSERTLAMARDRFGEKPLYYGMSGRTLVFGSELKALVAHPDFPGKVSREALTLYLRFGYVPSPYSIYQDIGKLPPGTCLRLGAPSAGGVLPEPRAYWTLAQAYEEGREASFRGTETDAVVQLESLIAQAVRLQMVADVPLGAFLSGGVDSSTIVALMQKQSSRRVKTFTIGFAHAEYNEADSARAVAAHLGTDHTELQVTAADALDLIPQLPAIYDEPYADASAIPTLLVSRLARSQVTVSLSGDGGDELFGGYTRYQSTARHWDRLQGLPRAARKALGSLVQHVPSLMDRYPALHEALASNDAAAFYRSLMSQWPTPSQVVSGGHEPSTVWDRHQLLPRVPLAEKMMYLDSLTYLPDDVLCKVDRAAMSVSLETRVPLLDHRIVAFAWSLPGHLRIRGQQGKWILRQVLNRHVPRHLTDRPKQGFAVPVDHWLRGPLREWAEALLDESRLREDGYLDPGPIRRRWKQHLAGRMNWRDPLWAVLMFQSWVGVQRAPHRRPEV